MLQIDLHNQHLVLHPLKAAYWQEAHMLLLADLHLGKASHFRREGIPVPSSVSQQNWDKLLSLLMDFSPRRVLFLGDLFHSEYNAEWEDFCDLLRQFSGVQFELVPGNHDILPVKAYERAGLLIREEAYVEGPFLFTHHPLEEASPAGYNLAGHVHPGVFLRGRGRQGKKVPCFFFGEYGGILPAFGAFTGSAILLARNGDRVFVVAGEEVLEV